MTTFDMALEMAAMTYHFEASKPLTDADQGMQAAAHVILAFMAALPPDADQGQIVPMLQQYVADHLTDE